MDFSWFPVYLPLILKGISLTLVLLVISLVIGFALAVPPPGVLTAYSKLSEPK